MGYLSPWMKFIEPELRNVCTSSFKPKVEYILMLLKQIKNETYLSELLQWFPAN